MAYTTIVAGTVANAAWANANVRDQVITPFASASARDAAITSPVDGMVCVITGEGTHGLVYQYNGTAWVPLSNQVISEFTVSAQTSHTISSIPSGFGRLVLELEGQTSAASGDAIRLQVNAETGASAYRGGMWIVNCAATPATALIADHSAGNSDAVIAYWQSAAGCSCIANIMGASDATANHGIQATSARVGTADTTVQMGQAGYRTQLATPAAVSSVKLLITGGATFTISRGRLIGV